MVACTNGTERNIVFETGVQMNAGEQLGPELNKLIL